MPALASLVSLNVLAFLSLLSLPLSPPVSLLLYSPLSSTLFFGLSLTLAALAESSMHASCGLHAAGHEEYTLYFQSEKTYKRIEQMVEMDATAFHYSFGLDGPFNAPLLGRGGSA